MAACMAFVEDRFRSEPLPFSQNRCWLLSTLSLSAISGFSLRKQHFRCCVPNSFSEAIDAVNLTTGINQQMNVLGHDDVCPNVEVVFRSCFAEALEKYRFGMIADEQG